MNRERIMAQAVIESITYMTGYPPRSDLSRVRAGIIAALTWIFTFTFTIGGLLWATR